MRSTSTQNFFTFAIFRSKGKIPYQRLILGLIHPCHSVSSEAIGLRVHINALKGIQETAKRLDRVLGPAAGDQPRAQDGFISPLVASRISLIRISNSAEVPALGSLKSATINIVSELFHQELHQAFLAHFPIHLASLQPLLLVVATRQFPDQLFVVSAEQLLRRHGDPKPIPDLLFSDGFFHRWVLDIDPIDKTARLRRGLARLAVRARFVRTRYSRVTIIHSFTCCILLFLLSLL